MDDELRAELLRRVETDQAARTTGDAEAAARADQENLPWLKQVVADRGWPGRSLVGPDGAHAAWLLAQHADRDPAFQRQCLDLLSPAVAAGEAPVRELAYLTDRVLLAEHQPQVYGTQVIRQGSAWQARDLGDPDGVDERRAAVGLEPLAEYLERFEHLELPQPSLECPGCGTRVPHKFPESTDSFTVTCPACGMVTTVRVLE